jgi:hypothetical protein
MKHLISIFESVRDMPYWIGDCLENQGMDCVEKHHLLKKQLEKEGIVCRFRSCIFHWNDMPFPKEVLNISHDETCDHTFLEIQKSDGEWITLDATWDKGLASHLPISEWDGETSTSLAMKFERIASPEESEKLANSWTKERLIFDFEKNGAFYTAIDRWLKEIRL